MLETMKIRCSTVVTLAYDITTQRGEIVETSDLTGPVTIMQGQGSVLPGLDAHLSGMEAGESKSVQLPPEEAFGRSEDAPIKEIPRDEFPASHDLKAGERFEADLPAGGSVRLEIVEVMQDHVSTKILHPLADETINLDFRVIEVRDPTQREKDLGQPVLSPPPAPSEDLKQSA